MFCRLNSFVCCTILCLFFFSSNASAQVTANPTRPSAADNAYLTAQNYFELEAGWAGDDNSWSLPALLKYGLSKRVELGFAMNGLLNHANDTEVGDPAAQLKYQAASGDWGGFALVGRTDFPSGGDAQFTGYAVLSALTSGLQIDATLGQLIYNSGFADAGESVFYAVALAPRTSGKLGGFIELFGQDAGTRDQLSLDGGLSFAHSNRLVSDVSVTFGLNSDTPDYVVQVGFTTVLFGR